jgi:hypothetical protein
MTKLRVDRRPLGHWPALWEITPGKFPVTQLTASRPASFRGPLAPAEHKEASPTPQTGGCSAISTDTVLPSIAARHRSLARNDVHRCR